MKNYTQRVARSSRIVTLVMGLVVIGVASLVGADLAPASLLLVLSFVALVLIVIVARTHKRTT